MEEGQKLSKTEMKHMTTLKQLRAKGQEQNKEITTLKQRLTKAEKSITEQSERAKRAEASEKGAQEKLKIVDKIEKDINTIRAEREEANLTITELRKQLNEALSQAEDAEKRAKAGALEAEKRVTSSLQEDLDNLRIEKKLSEDRAKKEIQAAKEQAKSQQEKANITELELRGEIAVSDPNSHVQSSTDTLTRTSNQSSNSFVAVLRKLHRQRPVTLKPSCYGRSKHCRRSTRLLQRTGKASSQPLHLESPHWKRTAMRQRSVSLTSDGKRGMSTPRLVAWRMSWTVSTSAPERLSKI